jgi:hypothetical protein
MFPKDKYDQNELARLNAEPWMVEQLKLNPDYVSWGPHEDYMYKEKGAKGWDAPVEYASWKGFSWALDEMNECVNFYFQVTREFVDCDACDQTGYNPETKKISDDFYDFENTGRRWCEKITQDEVDALLEAGRLRTFRNGSFHKDPLTAEFVNAANRSVGKGFDYFHDAINYGILIKTRATRLGVFGRCAKCDGHGRAFTAPAAHLQLVLWVLHPRKGCSRGVEIKQVDQDDLPSVYAWLRTADERNRERFSKLPRAEKTK